MSLGFYLLTFEYIFYLIFRCPFSEVYQKLNILSIRSTLNLKNYFLNSDLRCVFFYQNEDSILLYLPTYRNAAIFYVRQTILVIETKRSS